MVGDGPPASTGTLVVGAGLVGCSTAYHLAALGREDVTVVDRGPLPATGGTSSFAPAAVFQTAPDGTASALARETRALAVECDAYEETGSVEVATTDEGVGRLDRRMDQAVAWGVEGPERLPPSGVAEHLPMVDPDRIEGGYRAPTDGRLSGLDLLSALRDRARAQGVTFHGETRVTGVGTDRGAVDSVATDRGEVDADDVVVASGVWTPLVGEMAGVDVPLAAAVHQYAVTEPVPDLAGSDAAPWLRHPEGGTYVRRHGDALGIGNYDHEPRLVDPADIGRDAIEAGPIADHVPGEDADDGAFRQPAARPFTEADFADARAELERLVPALDGVAVDRGVDGLLAVTPDGNPILGEHPDVDGFHLAAALRATHAGGAGKVLAEMMERGSPSVDVDPWHAARFQPHSGAPAFLREQAAETYRTADGTPGSGSIETTGKTVRESPFYRYQDALGADFYDLRYGGWKRPMRFGTNESLLTEYDIPERAGRGPGWEPVGAVEHLAVRDRVGMCDLTSFTTFDVVGADAPAFVQHAFSNDMDLPVGGVTYTLVLDDQGGIMGDMTVVRRAHDRYHAVSNSGGAGTKQIAHLRRLAADYDSVVVSDEIGARCGVSMTGPNAREALEPVVDADLSNDAFPYFSAAETYVEDVPVLALRVSYVGELGWEFHTSMEYGAELWETLWEAGQGHGVLPFGDAALVTLRLEKDFPAYGVDVHPGVTPLEAGATHAVDFDTEFVGRDALLAQRDAGLDHERVTLTLDDPDAVVGSGIPVLDGDDRIGHVTSAGEAYHVDEFVLYAYLPPSYDDPGTGVEVQHGNERYAATVRDGPLFDPERERLLS